MKPSLERNIQPGFAVALATVIAAGAATLRSAAATGESAKWVGQALVQQLRRLTDDNPSQRHRVDSLAAVALAGLAVSEA